MHVGAGVVAGDPLALARGQGDPPVDRQSEFQRHQRPPAPDSAEIAGEAGAGGLCAFADIDRDASTFRTESLLSREITSRTYSFYYPKTRPEGRPRCLIVSSTNARYEDWAELSEEDYQASKRDLCETTLDALDKYVPNIRQRVVHVEASTPRTFKHYTAHIAGASFGTKFEGLAVSRALPQQIAGLYHAGSVGIIMSGWLGAMNYGVIVANEVDNHLMSQSSRSTSELELELAKENQG